VTDERLWTPSELLRRYAQGERDFQGLEIEDPDDPSSFRDAVLDGADFSRCFVVADFCRARMRGCRFTEANVKTCIFDEADLRGSDFSGAAIDAATFRSALLEDANFTGATEQGHCMKPGELPFRAS
jgi:2-iminobutanoate/2-iminopropanoate deaminase